MNARPVLSIRWPMPFLTRPRGAEDEESEMCVIPTFYLCLRITDLMAQTGQFVIPVAGIRELFFWRRKTKQNTKAFRCCWKTAGACINFMPCMPGYLGKHRFAILQLINALLIFAVRFCLLRRVWKREWGGEDKISISVWTSRR